MGNILVDKQLFVFGSNQYGQLGSDDTFISVPIQCTFSHAAVQAFCGPYSTFLLTSMHNFAKF